MHFQLLNLNTRASKNHCSQFWSFIFVVQVSKTVNILAREQPFDFYGGGEGRKTLQKNTRLRFQEKKTKNTCINFVESYYIYVDVEFPPPLVLMSSGSFFKKNIQKKNACSKNRQKKFPAH